MGIELTLSEAENQGSKLIQAVELIMANKKKSVVKQIKKDQNQEENGQ